MREQLIQYVNLLFAGAKDCEEIRQEILQNTLDRYDDLIAEGKVPEAAYRLAITGIGDINEILGTSAPGTPVYTRAVAPETQPDSEQKKRNRAIAIGLYIVAAIPVILLGSTGFDIWGVSITLLLVAAATILLIANSSSDDDDEDDEEEERPLTPQQELKKSIDKLLGTLGLVIFLVLSFTTQMWYITWLVFPIMGAVKGLVSAILDLKEAVKHEN